MPALILKNPLPLEMVLLSAETVDKIAEACQAAAEITVVSTPEELANADAAVKYLAKFAKTISDGRMALTRPLDDFKKQAIAAQEQGCEPLLSRAKQVQALIKIYADEQMRQHQERLRLAEIERQRLQAIADAEAEETRARLQKEADDITENPEERQVVVVDPVYIQGPIVPKLVKSTSTRGMTLYSLEFIDATKVPIYSPKGDLLRPCDEGAIKKYLQKLPPGQREIPGAVKLIETESTALKG